MVDDAANGTGEYATPSPARVRIDRDAPMLVLTLARRFASKRPPIAIDHTYSSAC
jgi:hypothetical protein